MADLPAADYETVFPYKYWFTGWIYGCWVSSTQEYRLEIVSARDASTNTVVWNCCLRMRDGTIRWHSPNEQATPSDFDKAIERAFFSKLLDSDRKMFRSADFSRVTGAREFEVIARKLHYLDAPKSKSKK